MKKGAKLLLGTHNFSTFRSSNCSAKSPVRTINEIIVSKSKNQIKLIPNYKNSRVFNTSNFSFRVGCFNFNIIGL